MTIRSERWSDGELGIYSPGDAWAFRPTDVMLSAHEAQVPFPTPQRSTWIPKEMPVYFGTIESVREWIRHGARYDRSYTPEGLVFGMEEASGPGPIVRAVHVELYQVMLNGKPARLPGGDASVVRIEHADARKQ